MAQTTKMFVHYNGTIEEFKKLSNLTDYANKIVFIKGGSSGKGAAIYTHGEYYTTAHDIEAAVANLKIIKGVKAGDVIKYAQNQEGILTFSNGDECVIVAADGPGITISVSDSVKDAVSKKHSHNNKSVLDNLTQSVIDNSHTHSNKTELDKIADGDKTKWDEAYTKRHEHSNKTVIDGITSTKVSNWDTAFTNNHTHTNKSVLDGITSDKVSKWDAAQPNVIETVKVNGVALTPNSDKAVDVIIPAATVTGVKSGDKILSLNGTELVSTLTFTKEKISNKEYLIIKGIDGVEIGKVDTADFTADSFLNNVELEGNELVFTFNTESGKDKVRVDISKYIDTYTAGNGIDITSNKVSAKLDSTSESFLTVGTGGIKLSGVQAAINTAVANKNVSAEGDAYISASATNNKVTVTATEATKASLALADSAVQTIVTGATDGTIKVDGKDVAVKGLGSAAYTASTAYATSAQGTKADSALQSISEGTDGTYVTTTVTNKSNNTQTIGVDVKTKAVAEATSTNNGLATAYDAKSYADNLFAWEEL